MIVLSLFDGVSCGRLALERAGITVTKYYASEIDNYAIQIAQKNYPDTIQLGDINNWMGWDIEQPDLIIGGSPCQGFSIAGKRLAFDDPRSKLFFKFVEIIEFYQPKYFLLENVKMRKEHIDVISQNLGVDPVCINSALVSAQNRVRYYWTNIPGVTQPEDKNIYLKDIIENGAVDKDKSYCIDANYWKGGNLKSYFEKHRRQLVFNLKSENKRVHNVSIDERGIRPYQDGKKRSGLFEFGRIAFDTARKLTPIECERLQTIPDNYTQSVSNTQRYKTIGNAWTVDVIAHIFKDLKQQKDANHDDTISR